LIENPKGFEKSRVDGYALCTSESWCLVGLKKANFVKNGTTRLMVQATPGKSGYTIR
jgi:hypothetical protein